MSGGRVCAFVLTRDRPALLAECLRGLLAQTRPPDAIVVLDNASAEPVRDVPAGVRLYRAAQNTGGAGGYAQGRELALGTGADWIWFMDDDAEPVADALERLLAAADEPGVAGAAAVCCAVTHPDGTLDRMHRCRLGRFVTPLPASAYAPGTRADVDCASFVGLLARADAARAAGPIRAEMFLGYDDAEWSLRLRRHGPIRLVPESRMLHKIVIGGGERTRRAALWNRLLGQEYASSPWPAYWKDLYRVRNLAWMRRDAPRREFALLLAGYAAKTLMYEPRPLRRLPWLVRYAFKGRRGDFRALTPSGWTRRVARSPWLRAR